ncbi:MAG TPA: hypothetical protein VKD72_04760 [Gemmataceae bacterium]|nr:hypothetical protein [Gemmataceae bacterium]
MNPSLFDELERTLTTEGASAALDRLCTRLRERQDYDNLFYARLMAKRYELGVSPVPTAPTSDVPPERQGEFEETIRRACREVGGLYLEQGNIPQAWMYYRMVGDSVPVEQALDEARPDEGQDLEPLIQIALYEGVLPRKGFDWVLTRYGLCSAITTLGGHQLPLTPEARQYCVGRLVRTLYQELRDRLSAEIERQEGQPPPEASAPPTTLGLLRKLMAGRDWLFGDDAYHIDLSHLNSVVQMSLDLSPGDDLERARELCEYGQRLSRTYQNPADPPFDDTYRDHGVYLAVLAGDNTEAGLAHFRAKVEANPVEEAGTGPAEVLIQLLLRLGRPAEALAVARRHLATADAQRLAYLADLCQKADDYTTLAEVAREQSNAVQFMAGLLASRPKG